MSNFGKIGRMLKRDLSLVSSSERGVGGQCSQRSHFAVENLWRASHDTIIELPPSCTCSSV